MEQTSYQRSTRQTTDRDSPVSVAYVTCRFPPMASSGTFRVEAMLNHLPEHGLRLLPITIPPSWVRTHSGGKVLHGESQVHGYDVLRPEFWFDRPVQALSRTPVVRWAVRELAIPDNLIWWARAVPGAVSGEVEEAHLVYATSPPFSAMVAARDLATTLGVPLVQEIRDPPSFNRRLRGRSGWTKSRMLRFEREHLAAADAVIMVTPGTRQRLLDLHPSLRAESLHVVPNGYPEIDIEPRLASRDPSRFTIAYVGSFQGSVSQRPGSRFTPEVVIPALEQLPGRPELRIVGPVSDQQRSVLAAHSMVTLLGRVPRPQALAEIAAADACLILAEDDPWWVGRKVYEYLAYAKRVLAVIPEGDTAKLLARSTKSKVIGLDDPQGLEEALDALHTSWLHDETPVGPEPIVPTDHDCAAGVASVLWSVMTSEDEPGLAI